MEKTITFNNWLEVSEWWSANPSAKRISPEFDTEDINEYNEKNHSIEFPCEMTFSI